MSDGSGYVPVVAVKRSNSGFLDSTDRFCICLVPDGACIDSGDVVFYGFPDEDKRFKGVCVSDVLFISEDTCDMICRITNENPADMPQVLGRVDVHWFSGRKEDAIEQALL
jgi:hypothetical protein